MGSQDSTYNLVENLNVECSRTTVHTVESAIKKDTCETEPYIPKDFRLQKETEPTTSENVEEAKGQLQNQEKLQEESKLNFQEGPPFPLELEDGVKGSLNNGFELSNAKNPVSLYVISLDLESTGLNMNTALGDQCDSICQIAVDVQEIQLQPKIVTDHLSSVSEKDENATETTHPASQVRWVPSGQFERLIKPLKKMSKGAAEVTGITDEKLAGCKQLLDVFEELQKYLETVCQPGRHRVLMAYNGLKFDFKMLFIDLMRCLEKHSQNSDPVKWLRKLKIDWLFDPLVLARSNLERDTLIHNIRGNCSFKLGDVYESMYKKKLENAHDALADCIAVNEVLKHSLFAPHFRDVVSRILETESPAETDAVKSPMKYFKEVARLVDQKKILPSVKEQITTKLKRLRNLKRKAPVNEEEPVGSVQSKLQKI
jgi:DNA polymerase III epsilon subunit-like protein